MNTTTKLEAVNTLLTSIGEDPLNALGLGLEDQTVAEAILDEVTRKTLIRGWSWNTEYNFKLTRQQDQTITVPLNYLSIDFQDTQRYTLRGRKVYDRIAHSYALASDITAGSIIIGLDWDEIPEVARQYITYSGGRVFQQRQVGSSVLHRFTQQDEREAWIALKMEEEAVSNHSIFHNPHVQMMLDRSPDRPVVRAYPGSLLGRNLHG